MKNEKWTEEIFDSLEGMKRAKPDINLYNKIENQLFSEESKVIPINRLRFAAVAAIFILLVNVISLKVYINSSNSNPTVESQTSNNYNQQLISNFKIYE